MALVGILPVIILELVLTNISENTVITTRLQNVSAQFNVFTSYVAGSAASGSDREMADLSEEVAGMYMSRIQVIDRDFNIITDTYNINKGKICVSQDVNVCFNGTNKAYADKTNQCIIH